MIKTRNVFIFLITLINVLISVSCAPSVVSSTYEIKETNIFGKTSRYAIFETEFNEDLYFLNQWPCPCNTEAICPIGAPDTPFDDSDIDNIIILEENEWFRANSSYSEELLLKFEFNEDPDFECPLLFIEYEVGAGSLSLFMSYNEIPSSSSSHWYRGYFTHGVFSICPGHDKYKYGTYYIRLENQDGVYPFNEFRIRISRKKLPSCPTEPYDNDGEYLIDAVPRKITIPSEETLNFKFSVPLNNGCSNFSISSNSLDISGDVDIYISTEFPEDGTRVSASDGDDYLNFIYCTKRSGVNEVDFNIELSNLGDNMETIIVATTQQWFPLERKISETLYSQFSFTNSYGNFPSITCGEQVFECRFPTYEGCSEDKFGCCAIFFIVPPSENLNPLIPWNADDEFYSTLMNIPYVANFPLKPKTLSWGVLMQTKYLNNTKIHLFSDPSECKITEFGNGIVNINYEIISDAISFKPKERKCPGFQTFMNESKKISDLISLMNNEQDYYTLAKYHIKLNEIMFSPNVTGCFDYFHEFIKFQNETIKEIGKSCNYPENSLEWQLDPCCNTELELTMCCNRREYSYIESLPKSAIENFIAEQCSSTQCTKNFIEDYISNQASINNMERGCETTFVKVAGIHQRANLSNFVMECWNEIMVETCVCDDLRECTCNDEDQLIECLAERMDERISRLLFNDWGIPDKVTKERLILELTSNFMVDQCTGPGSIKFRDHYWYRPYIADCIDDCIEEPRCFDTSCKIPEECDGSITQRCYRFWGFISKDDDACENNFVCNWDPDPNNPSIDELDCEVDVCLDCNGKRCKRIEGVGEAECTFICNNGNLPSGDPCPDFCDTKCSGDVDCLNEAQCLSTGVCSDVAYDFGTGKCIVPYSFTSGHIDCEIFTPFGCVDEEATSEAECEGEWFEPSQTEAQCIQRKGCFNSELGIFTTKSEEECQLCDDSEWRQYFTWKRGNWIQGEQLELVWTQGKYTSRTEIQSSFDMSTFLDVVNDKIGELFSYSFETEGRCRYGVSLGLMESCLCDCMQSDSETQCFKSTSEQHIASGKACPYIKSSINAGLLTINIFEDSFPPENFCQEVTVYRTPVSHYQLDPSRSVSSAMFQNTETNAFWVVKNNMSVEIGQILSSGYLIDFSVNLTSPIELCIGVEVNEVSTLAKVYTLAYLNDENQIVAFSGKSNYSESEKRVCGLIWDNGTYFSAIAVENFEKEEHLSKSMIIQGRVGAAIYFFVIICAIIQFIRIFLFLKGKPLYAAKLIFVFIVFINSLVRAIYLLLPLSTTRAAGMEAFKFFIFEFPSILIFMVFISIIYLWLNIVNKSRFMGNKKKQRKADKKTRIILISMASAMLFVFVLFMILIAVSPYLDEELPCYIGNVSGSLSIYRITLAYWIFLCIANFLVSLAFTVSLILLLKPLIELNKKGVIGDHLKTELKIISAVAILCIICMLIRSSLFLYVTITRKSISPLASVILEAIPSLGLLYYLSPIKSLSDFSGSSKDRSSNNNVKLKSMSSSRN